MTEKKWKKYEWLITKIYHDNRNSDNVKVKYNVRGRGKISGQIRQIDILVEETLAGNRQKITVIDCKKLGGKVDIKGVEEFIGMYEDLEADLGIIVSSEGFTTGADKRVKNRDDIFLETIEWEKAYEKAEEAFIPNRLRDLCEACYNPRSYGKGVPGLILWELMFTLIIDGIHNLFGVGQCVKCKADWLYCDPCGSMYEIKNKDFTCPSCDIDYSAIKEILEV